MNPHFTLLTTWWLFFTVFWTVLMLTCMKMDYQAATTLEKKVEAVGFNLAGILMIPPILLFCLGFGGMIVRSVTYGSPAYNYLFVSDHVLLHVVTAGAMCVPLLLIFREWARALRCHYKTA